MKKFILITGLFIFAHPLFGQYRTDRYDTTYYISYRNKLTLGTLVNKKNTGLNLNTRGADHLAKFQSNSPGRFGFSAGHDFVVLSGTFGTGFMDPTYSKNKGETKQTNLQLNITGRKVLGDVFFQKYKGFYFSGNDNAVRNNGSFYIRPDIETKLYGASVSLIHNNRKFSAQASFLLDAWQKKSAGSLLYGGAFFWGSANADSAFIPSALANQYPHSEVSKINFITFGPGLGYGHTLVIKKHVFLTAMGSLNGDVTHIKEWSEADRTNSFWKFNPNLKVKGAVGYSSEKWGVGLSYTSNRIFFTSADTDIRYSSYNDNYKLMYARRINAGKTVPKITNWARKAINTIGLGFLIN